MSQSTKELNSPCPPVLTDQVLPSLLMGGHVKGNKGGKREKWSFPMQLFKDPHVMPRCQLTLSQIRGSHPSQMSGLAPWRSLCFAKIEMCRPAHWHLESQWEACVPYLAHSSIVLWDPPKCPRWNGHHILVQGNGCLPSGRAWDSAVSGLCWWVGVRRREEWGTTPRTEHLGARPHLNHVDMSKQLNSYILVLLITFTLALTTKQYMFIIKN